MSHVAQRRGRGTDKASTVFIPEVQSEGNGISTEVQSDSLTQPVAVARVHRNFCGTGPFDRHWLNMDCCGIICALVTYGLHLYGVYAVTLVLLPPWMSYKDESSGEKYMSLAGNIHRLVFTAVATIAIISHIKAMTTDPGAVPPDAKPLDMELQETNESGLDNSTSSSARNPLESTNNKSLPQVKRLCRRCKAFKPARAHHCSICQRCIIKMDHHCPWVNNCVGIGNHKYFLLFIFYTFLSCCYSLILVVTRFSTCSLGLDGVRSRRRHHHVDAGEAMYVHQNQTTNSCLDKPSYLLTILGLLVEAILFGMFTSCMIFDQADVVRSKITHIDRFKGNEIGGSLSGVIEVFGTGNVRRGIDSRFRSDWLSPFVRVCFPSTVHDEIMGFCRPCEATVHGVERVVDAAKAAVGSLGTMSGARPAGAVNMNEIV